MNNISLYYNQYSEEELIENINYLYMTTIVQTQKNLSYNFVINYILNDDYQDDEKDSNLTISYVAHCQPHLKDLLV
jgi:hypothetical protein